MQARGITLGDLIDRYTLELYPVKRWGRTKSADLARLKADLGDKAAIDLTSYLITEHFRKRYKAGAGGVVIAAQAGYLVAVLRTARTLWHLDVPLQAAINARSALASIGMVSKSDERDRRVSDAEIGKLIACLAKWESTVPMADILRFCMASAMRISEVCRLEWRDFDEKAKTIVVRDRKHPKKKLGNDMTVPLLDATGFDAFEIAKGQPRSGPRIFPHNAKTVSTYATLAVTESKIEDLHLHDLRHEAISRLFAAGYRIEQVALVSGHRDWKSLKRYTHVTASDLHRDAARSPK
jgi:integrase